MKKTELISYLIFVGCSHPLEQFYEELKKYGYIPYLTPLKYSGTGTLIGGNILQMQLIANPQTCFPDQTEGTDNNIRFRDDSVLANRYENIMVDTKLRAKFFDMMKSASPSIKVGLKHQRSEEYASRISRYPY